MTSPELNSIYCPRCGATVSWPALLDEARKAQLGAAAREDRLLTMGRLGSDFGLPLDEAKAVVTHIARGGDVCARCKSVVGKGETVCPNCKSANLNW